MRVELLEPGNHLLLMLMQHGVVDRDGDLVGECGQQTLVLGPVTLLLVPYADHPDYVVAHSERYSEKAPHAGVARWLASTRRVTLDIVGDVRAAFGDHDPEDGGTKRHAPEPLKELRIGRSKPLYRDQVHVDPTLVHEANDPRRRFRESQAVRQRQVVDLRQDTQAGDLHRNRVQRFQLVSERVDDPS